MTLTTPNLYNFEEEKRKGNETTALICLHGVYFHGFCDDHDDLVYFTKEDAVFFGPQQNTCMQDLAPGYYDVVVYGEAAVLYYWVDNSNPNKPRGRGLVVQPNTPWQVNAVSKWQEQHQFL